MLKPVIFTLSVLLFNTAAMAVETNVYCVGERGEILNAAETDECKLALEESKACFVGIRREVIRMINSNDFTWDEEWIEGAHYKGRNEVAYTYKDGPNELETKASMKRCPGQ